MNILHPLGGAALGLYMGYDLDGIELGLFLAVALPLGALIVGGGTSGSGGGWSGDCAGDGGGD